MTQTYGSYCLTVRPRGGITDDTLNRLSTWVEKQSYGFLAVEMENEARHAHAQVWLDDPRTRGTICTALVRICEETIKDWDQAQKKVLRNGVRIAYSDWYLDYLSDNLSKLETEQPDVRVDNPPITTNSFYPTEEEQLSQVRRRNAADQRYFELNEKLIEWLRQNNQNDSITLYRVADFINDAQFGLKVIAVMKDRQTRMNTAKNLWYYHTGFAPTSEALSNEDEALRNWCLSLEGERTNDYEQENQGGLVRE